MSESEFGNFQETFDWIECVSSKSPENIYFFNLRTFVSTWTRPVPQNVRLQRFKNKSNLYSDNSTDLTDISLMTLSSESERDVSYNKKNTESKKMKKNDSSLNNKTINNSKLTKHLYYVNKDKLSSDNDVKNSSKKSNSSEESKIYENFNRKSTSTRKLNTPKSKSTKVVNKLLNWKGSSMKKDKKDSFVRNIRYNAVKPNDLLAKNKVNKTKQTQSKQNESKVKTTIREMYGSKTINYDFDVPQLEVKTSRLSESSVASSLQEPNNCKPIFEDSYEFFDVRSQLTLSSSTSSTSICFSCCNTIISNLSSSTLSNRSPILSMR